MDNIVVKLQEFGGSYLEGGLCKITLSIEAINKEFKRIFLGKLSRVLNSWLLILLMSELMLAVNCFKSFVKETWTPPAAG